GHTRFSRDWSADVCSSDLREVAGEVAMALVAGRLHLNVGADIGGQHALGLQGADGAGEQLADEVLHKCSGFRQGPGENHTLSGLTAALPNPPATVQNISMGSTSIDQRTRRAWGCCSRATNSRCNS